MPIASQSSGSAWGSLSRWAVGQISKRGAAGLFTETEPIPPVSPNLQLLLWLDGCSQGQSQKGPAALPRSCWPQPPTKPWLGSGPRSVPAVLSARLLPACGGGHSPSLPFPLAPDAGAWLCDLSCSGPYPTNGYTIPLLPPPRLVQGSTESDEEVGWEEETEP